ncbi:DUF2164 domain-containing protein [Thalassotalea euphylliae]|uniref:DUF2164 domain-containing protein n=1 Tax=Thalassotalea euphylliae TaxID=1655234 RepID=A0A3E0TWT5_9GAMM|nr:DUF2164 domain-containing protein [Thalassotalea euphylliae]REL28803.1 DUF2164 domain-containing protein [Thalassotalea euphylliae]
MQTLSKAQKEHLTEQLSTYLLDELSIDIGGFDAEFLCDFVIEQFAPHFYNQGLAAAQLKMQQQVDLISDAVDELIMPTER